MKRLAMAERFCRQASPSIEWSDGKHHITRIEFVGLESLGFDKDSRRLPGIDSLMQLLAREFWYLDGMARRNRRLRFSLRTLFVVVTLCALVSPALPSLAEQFREWLWPDPWTEVGGPGSIREFHGPGCVLVAAPASLEEREEVDEPSVEEEIAD
jgi:hypothetical protein